MRRKKVFYGWWILLATSLIHFWGAGIIWYSFTAFFNPLVQEFRWSYAAISLAASFRGIESGIASPIVGFLTDKIGPRRLLLAGAVVAGAGCILMSRISSLWSYYATFIFLSIGASLLLPLPGWTAVAHWFSRKRGIAMGILLSVVGASGVLILLVNWLIVQYGWRTTFIIAGVGVWVISIPLSLVVRHRPEQYGYLPDGQEPMVEEAETEVKRRAHLDEGHIGFGVRQAIKTRAFWMLALVATLSSGALSAVVLHVMPCLISVQIPRDTASSIAAAVVVSSIAGRFGFGWLGDRIDKRYLLASALLLQVLGLIIFAYARSLPYMIAFLVLFGPGYGGVITLRLTIQADYFGRKAFGSIQGVLQGVLMVGTVISPVFAGWVYDIQGSYQWAWLVLAMPVLSCVPLVLVTKRPKE